MKPPVAASAASPPDPNDFPDWIDPMVVKELRQGMQARMFVVPFMIVQFAAVATIAVEWALLGAVHTGSGVWTVAWAAEGAFFWVLIWILLAFVFPLRGLLATEDDINGANLELIVMTGLADWKIASGRWLVLCAQSWLLLVSLVPYFLARYFLGQLDVGANLYLLGLVLAFNAAACAIVVGASTYAGRLARSAIGLGGIGVAMVSMSLPAAFGYWAVAVAVGTGFPSPGPVVLLLLNLAGTFLYLALYVLYGLKLARCRIRRLMRPDATAPDAFIASLIFITPLIVVIGTFFCGVGGLVALIGLAVMVWKIDSPRQVRGSVLPVAPPASPAG